MVYVNLPNFYLPVAYDQLHGVGVYGWVGCRPAGHSKERGSGERGSGDRVIGVDSIHNWREIETCLPSSVKFPFSSSACNWYSRFIAISIVSTGGLSINPNSHGFSMLIAFNWRSIDSKFERWISGTGNFVIFLNFICYLATEFSLRL